MYREGKTRRTERHLAWVRRQHFETAGLDALIGQHLAIIEARLQQRELMDGAIERIAVSEPYAAAVRRLCCLRRIKSLSALTLPVEVGDFRRFAAAAAFMGFTGLVPSEASSGERHHRGSSSSAGPRTSGASDRRSTRRTTCCAGPLTQRGSRSGCAPAARSPRWSPPRRASYTFATPSCSTCGTNVPAEARFCYACGTPLAPPAAVDEERKIVTALFADLVGFTTRAEALDPEDVRSMLVPYYGRLRSELERFGGTVEKFIGDAVMALFGAPTTNEDDPERAVRAALGIRAAIAKLNADEPDLGLHLRIGINTGEALVALKARPREGEGMAAGDVVNTAARLQANAPVDGILVGEATYRATAHVIDYRQAEPVHAKGKAQPVPAWEVLGVKAAPARTGTTGLPLVGRRAELGALTSLWDEVVREARAGIATVLGPPGIGKSRLIAEFTARVRETGAVYAGRCLPYGDGITYWPVAEIVKDACGILLSDDTATTAAKIETLLDRLAADQLEDRRAVGAAAGVLLGIPVAGGDGSVAATIPRAELHWGIRRLLELLAAARPTACVFEDLHWAEPTLLELLAYLGETAEGRLLIVGSGRPELKDAQPAILGPRERSRVIELAALGTDDSLALLNAVSGAGAIASDMVGRVLRNAGGNPLFLEETVRMLAELPAAERGADGGESFPVPSNLQSLIGSRLDRLPSETKRVAQQASVVGGVFWTGAVTHLGQGEEDVAASLRTLEGRDMVHERETSSIADQLEYAFKHILVRDVAYAQLPKTRRVALHVRCAEWVAAIPGGLDEFVEIVAYHLEQACLVARGVVRSPVPPPISEAVATLTRAAEKAERREGFREADRFYDRALALLDGTESEAAVELRLRRSIARRALGDLKGAAAELRDVATRARGLGREDLRGAALVALANVDYKQGRAADARANLAEGDSIAAAIGDLRLRVRAGFELAALQAHFDGALEQAIDGVRRALRIADELDDWPLRVEGHLRLGTLLFNLGRFVEAEYELTRCTVLAHEIESHRDEARATSLLAYVRYYRGDLDEAERLGLGALEWLERTGDTFFQVQNRRKLAMYAFARGQPHVAEERLREALPVALETGGGLVVDLRRLLTEALVRQGLLAEARQAADETARAVPAEDASAHAAALLAAASVATAAGDRARALSRYEEALVILEEQQLPVDLAEARMAFARALRRLGETGRAQEELRLARDTFAGMDALGMLGEIDRELLEVAKAPLGGTPSPSSLP